MLLAGSAAALGAAPGASVALRNVALHPGTVRIHRGQSVTWRWEDGAIQAAHNVTSIGTTHFRSSSTRLTGSYTVRFPRAGTFRYECTIHPASMRGQVVVSG